MYGIYRFYYLPTIATTNKTTTDLYTELSDTDTDSTDTAAITQSTEYIHLPRVAYTEYNNSRKFLYSRLGDAADNIDLSFHRHFTQQIYNVRAK